MSVIEFAWASTISGGKVPVYLGKPYQNLLANHDGSEARLIRCSTHGKNSYLPILVRELGGGLKEAYSAYGYGGILGEIFLSETDVDSLRRFLSEQFIIACFIRHSPFLANQHQWPSGITELNRHTYAVSLCKNENFDSYIKGIPQKIRWSVNYARRAGLQVTFCPLSECKPERIKAFYRLYAELMQQKKTSGYYLFSEDFFLEHVQFLGESGELAEIIDPENGELIAGAFFLLDETGWSHYHLSSATREAMKIQGMELLITSALQRYGNMGYRALHLGGGHSLDENDGLSRFKAKFADQKLEFSCTKLICDKVSYQTEYARMPLKNPNFFLISDARGN